MFPMTICNGHGMRPSEQMAPTHFGLAYSLPVYPDFAPSKQPDPNSIYDKYTLLKRHKMVRLHSNCYIDLNGRSFDHGPQLLRLICIHDIHVKTSYWLQKKTLLDNDQQKRKIVEQYSKLRSVKCWKHIAILE